MTWRFLYDVVDPEVPMSMSGLPPAEAETQNMPFELDDGTIILLPDTFFAVDVEVSDVLWSEAS